MNSETLKTQFADLVTLAEKVSRLNPDAGEIGHGMLRELVSLANRALGEGYSRLDALCNLSGELWPSGGDEDHWTSTVDGRRYTRVRNIGCEDCAFDGDGDSCKVAPDCAGHRWVLWATR